ncbi:MAG: flagellar hook-length control protein FliK, partial [Oscillospiraceae bacterium]
MAVSLNAPSTANLRSDYAISDAAMAQRNFDAAAAADQQQSSKFEEMLAQFDGKSQKLRDVQDALDSGKYDVPTLEDLEKAGVICIDKETGRVMPENPRDLAEKLFKGELDAENLPIELLTPEFLQALSAFTDNASEQPEDFFPTTDESVKNDVSKQLQNSGVLAELAQLIQAMTGETAENAELVEVTEQVAVSEVAAVQTEQIPEFPQKSEQKPQTTDTGRFDVFVQNDETAEIPVELAANTENPQNNANHEQSFTQGDIPEELQNLGEEKLNALQKAVSEGEISKVETKTVEVPEQKAAEKPVVDNTVDVPEKAEQSAEIPELRQRAQSVTTTVSEELEMLKNAKTKPVFEQTNVPVSTQNPLNSDSPIVFRREDGEVSVRPSEIISQAMKAVQTAVSENKEQTEYSLVLNPEELGRITVKMTKTADGAVSVTIAAENARTQRVL